MTANPHRINGRTIRILESEGLAQALNLACEVLDGHGVQKHGTRRWSGVKYLQHLRKGVRHAMAVGDDKESKLPHTAHAVVRMLMLLQLELRYPEKAKEAAQ